MKTAAKLSVSILKKGSDVYAKKPITVIKRAKKSISLNSIGRNVSSKSTKRYFSNIIIVSLLLALNVAYNTINKQYNRINDID